MIVDEVEYRPCHSSPTKKGAKLTAAHVVLDALARPSDEDVTTTTARTRGTHLQTSFVFGTTLLPNKD